MASKTPVKPPDAARVTARARKDPAFLKRALKKPGLRSKLAADLLPSNLARERALQTRLNAPVVPGSTVTGRELAHRAQQATTVEYAPLESELASQLKAAQQHQTDVGGWYDQYLSQIQGATARINAAQDAAVTGAQALGQGVQGLGKAETGQILNQAAQASGQAGVPGAAPSAALANQANQAQVARETLAANYAGQAQQQAATQKSLGEFVGGVVAPGQKMQALTDAQRNIQKLQDKAVELAREKGAYTQKTRADIRQQEVANVVAMGQLANQTLGAKTTAAAKAASAAASTPAGKAKVTAATEEAKQAAKLGLSVHQYRLLGPAERARRLAKTSTTRAGSDVITSGPLAGKTKTWVAAHPDAAGKLVDDYNAGKGGGKGAKAGKGPDWVTSGQQGTALTQAVNLRDYAAKAKAGQPFVAGHQKMPKMNRHQALAKLKASVAAPSNPIIWSAVLDAVYDGHLSRRTVQGLIDAGIKPSSMARTLNVPTAGQWRPRTGAAGYPVKGGAGAGQ